MKYNIGDKIRITNPERYPTRLLRSQKQAGYLVILCRGNFAHRVTYGFEGEPGDYDGDPHWLDVEENSVLYRKNYLLKPKPWHDNQ
jgi:hypothetical protein